MKPKVLTQAARKTTLPLGCILSTMWFGYILNRQMYKLSQYSYLVCSRYEYIWIFENGQKQN